MKKPAFQGQHDNEEALMVLKPHYIAVFKDLAVPLIIAVASATSLLYFLLMKTELITQQSWLMAYLLIFVVFVFSSFWFFYAYYVWVHDTYIITDERIIDREQLSLFQYDQKESYLNKVQDVIVSKKGVAATLFNFGSVSIQTASNTNLDLHDVPDPFEVKKKLMDLVQKAKDKDTSTTPASNDDMLKKLYDLLSQAQGAKSDETQKNG